MVWILLPHADIFQVEQLAGDAGAQQFQIGGSRRA
jgi:hypothetical protein